MRLLYHIVPGFDMGLYDQASGLFSDVGNGVGNAAYNWLDLYNRAMNPAMLNEPLGAWRRLATLGASVPIGGVADSLAIGGPALGKAALGADVLRGSSALANYADNALNRSGYTKSPSGTLYDPYTGAVIDSQGKRWY